MMNNIEIKKLLLSIQKSNKDKGSTFDLALKNLGVSIPDKTKRS